MARLIAALIRHGDYHQPEGVPSAHLLHPLTKKGREQARAAVDGVRAYASHQNLIIASVIDCSSLLRGWETANEMTENLNEKKPEVPYCTEEFDELAERCLGGAANLRVDEIEDVLAKDPRVGSLPDGWKSQSEFRLPVMGAESLIEAGQRVAQHILACLQRLRGIITEDTLKLFVGHGAAFRHAALEFGVLTPVDIPALSMHHARPVYLEWLTDGRWAHVGGEWKQRIKMAECGHDMD